MSLEDQSDEVVECSAQDQGVAVRRSSRLRVVEGVHQQEHLELAEGVAGYVADCAGEGDQDVDEDGVAADGEDGIVFTEFVDALVLVGAPAVGSAIYLSHIFI